MKVTVRQLRGRPGLNSWQPLLQNLQETGISKFIVDVSTDLLDDFFQHVISTIEKQFSNDKFRLSFLGKSRWTCWSVLRFYLNVFSKETKFVFDYFSNKNFRLGRFSCKMEQNSLYSCEHHQSSIFWSR